LHDVYGSHLSIAGGMVNALLEAERLKFDCVQVFTKNQRQWRVTPMRDEDRAAWLEKLHAMKWDKATGPARVVSHASYLINLASPHERAWQQSVELFLIELQRCDELKIPLCVVHPARRVSGAIRCSTAATSPMTRSQAWSASSRRSIMCTPDCLAREL